MKTLIISGGSSGIGLAAVKRFLQSDYRVFNLDIQDGEFEHDQLTCLPCDVTQHEEVESAMQKIATEVEKIDALVCNAGTHFSATILQSSEADFDRLMAINVKSAFLLAQAVIPWMLQAQKGAIVFMGSDQSIIAKKNSTLYCMTKTALSGLMKSIAIDFAKNNIRANLVAAGTVDTPMTQSILKNYSDRIQGILTTILQEEADEFPVGRIAQPEEIAELIYFLASEQARFMTGAVIPIDGGYTAR